MNVPNRPLRCALFGLGDWAWRHVRLIQNTPGFELAAISSRSDGAWERARSDLPNVRLYRNHRELLAAERPDLAVITTPHYLHAAMAIDALGAGAHVIVEKPLATTMADGRAMLEAAKTAGRMLGVYHNRHFDPWLVAAELIVRRGAIGRLVELNALWPGLPPPGTWRMGKRESGGLFFDLGAHLVDYLVTLAGSEPQLVSGHVHRVPGRDPLLNEDHAVAQIQFASGAWGRVYTSGLDLAASRRFHLIGEQGTLTDEWNWNGGQGEVRTRLPNGTVEVSTYTYGSESDSPAGMTMYANFAAHLFENAPLAVTPEQALRNIAVLLAAEKSSAADGTWVDVER
ncbi:MAG TPA: Gfo/Idh/MocA family oxidoreductase [Opitutaceae bacterium]|nr:Gfo/Idh/MocA family oxidoreductase [Opitutaceae bacterium]